MHHGLTINKTEVNDVQSNHWPLTLSIYCWSLCQCVIIPWKSTAALYTGESATDGALACYLHCRWDTCGDSIFSVHTQRQNIDPRQGLQQSLHQMTHCTCLCVNELGFFFFFFLRGGKKRDPVMCKQKQQNTS